MENTSTTPANQTFFSLRNRKPTPLVVEIANVKNALDTLLLGTETDAYVARHAAK